MAGSFAWRSGCSAGLRRGGSARSSPLIGGDRVLEGGCWPGPLGPRTLFGPCALRPFNSRRRNRMLGRQRGRGLGVVAEIKEEVYGHHYQKHAKYDDRHVEDVEKPVRSRRPPSMGDSYCATPLAAAGPPVPFAEDAHGGRNEQNADDRGVYENGHGEPKANRFGNDSCGGHQTLCDAGGVGVTVFVGLPDAGEEKYLIVHGDPEHRAEHQDREGGVHEAQRRKVEHLREVTILEDEDHSPEASRQAQDVHRDRLQRENDGAEGVEQYQVGYPKNERRRVGGLAVDAGDKVLLSGREAADEEAYALRWLDRAHITDGLAGCPDVGARLGDAPQQREISRHEIVFRPL